MGILDLDRRILAPSMALAGDIAAGRNSGTTMSVLTMAFGFGIAIGPLSAGYLAGVELPFGQEYVTPFVFGAALALVGFALVYTQVGETVQTNPPSDTSVDSSSGD